MKTTTVRNESKDASELAGAQRAAARAVESLCDAETGVCVDGHQEPRESGQAGARRELAQAGAAG